MREIKIQIQKETRELDSEQEVQGTRVSIVRQDQPSDLQILLMEIRSLVLKLVMIGLIIGALFTFVFGMTRCSGNAMTPAVKDGDLVLYYRLDRDYKASDAVAVNYAGGLELRRIVAVAGDEVSVTENGLMVNGAYIYEPDIYGKTEPYEGAMNYPVTVGEGEVFVLGDNRESAQDSRIWGCIEEDKIQGSVMMILRRRQI